MNEKLSSIQQHFFLFLTLNFSTNTIETYKRIITNFFIYIEQNFYQEDTLELMFLEYLQQKQISQSSKNLYISCYNSFCNYACNYHDCFCKVRLKHTKKSHRLPKAVEESVWMQKLNSIESIESDNWIKHRDIALVYLLYATGVRISEALNIKHIDFYNNQTLVISKTKNKKDRVVYCSNIAYQKIQNYCERCPYSTYKNLWFSKNGKKMTRETATMAIKKCTGQSAHKLRHTFATHMYRNGCDLLVLAELLGHSSVASTCVYISTTPKNLQESIKKYHFF